MKMRVVCLLGVMAVTAACSNALTMPESKLSQLEGMHCRHVTPTGSHRPRRVCTTRAERDRDANKARAELEDAMDYQRGREMQDRMEHREPMRP